jgi:hypothetical protein
MVTHRSVRPTTRTISTEFSKYAFCLGRQGRLGCGHYLSERRAPGTIISVTDPFLIRFRVGLCRELRHRIHGDWYSDLKFMSIGDGPKFDRFDKLPAGVLDVRGWAGCQTRCIDLARRCAGTTPGERCGAISARSPPRSPCASTTEIGRSSSDTRHLETMSSTDRSRPSHNHEMRWPQTASHRRCDAKEFAMIADLSLIEGLDAERLAVLAETLSIRTPAELVRADRRTVLAAMQARGLRPTLEEISTWQDDARAIASAGDPGWEQVAAFVVSFEQRDTEHGWERRVAAEQAEREPPVPREIWPDWHGGAVSAWMLRQLPAGQTQGTGSTDPTDRTGPDRPAQPCS